MGDKKDQRKVGAHDTHDPAKQPTAPDVAPAISSAQLQAQAKVYQPLDRHADSVELGAAMAARNADKILAILQRNMDPGAMYSLRLAYGDNFGADLHATLDATHYAQARAYAGEQISLTVQLGTHDPDAIFRDLEKLSDERALDLVMSARSSGVLTDDGKGPAPPSSSLGEVQAVLRKSLSADEYYRAMRLILDKAKRAIVHSPQSGLFQAVGFTADENEVRTGSIGQGFLISVAANPIPTIRVDLAEERLRAADGAKGGNKAELDAFLALADLSTDERKALAMRLQDKPLHDNPIDATQLAETDDATVIKQAIQNAGARALLNRQVARGIGLDVAIERAGKMIRDARAKVRDPSLPADQREPARKELERLEAMFFGKDSYYVKSALRAAAGADDDSYKDKLESIGADPVTVGAELLKDISPHDPDRLIAALKQIPAQHRREAMVRANKIDDLPFLPPERRELVNAYLDVGAPPVTVPVITVPADVKRGPSNPTSPDVPVLDVNTTIGALAPPPEVTIALADVVHGVEQGPKAAHIVLARLQRMPYDMRKILFAQPRYITAVAAMPKGEVASEERDFYDAIKRAEVSDTGPDLAIANYPGAEGPYQQVALEQVRMKAEKYGQATIRRGFVLHERVGNDPKARAALPPADRVAVEQYEELEGIKPTLNTTGQQETATDLMFGSVQLTNTSESTLDPNMEARFMNLRLHVAAGLASDKPLSSWTGGSEAIEALTEFQARYANESPGGVSRGALAQLAEIYYRALRELEKHRAKLAANEMLASLAATVAGVVVAVGIGILSGGTALPFLAVAGLSGVAAGTAAAAAGAAVRIKSTDGSVARDFGMGFVDGVTSIAGAGLAAKIVRGSAAGVGAGKAAAEIGAHVVSQATSHGGAAAIAEAAIDGAFSGAAGELFQTAVDEATWDRGVGEAIAKMLAAIARGGAMGALAGGVIAGGIAGLAKLAKNVGPEAAERIGTMLERSNVSHEIVDAWSPAAQKELARANELIEHGELAEAEKAINGIAGAGEKQRELLIAYARGRSAVRAIGDEAIDVGGKSKMPVFVNDTKFRELGGNEDAHAFVKVHGDEPTIYARLKTPRSAILEEVIHVRDFETDIATRVRMRNISEERLAKWPELGAQEKLSMHIDKLEVEAKAQRTIADHFSGRDDDPEAVIQALDAEETLFRIDERLSMLKAAKPPLDVAKLDIEKLPRLYSLSPGSSSAPASKSAKREIAGWLKKGNVAVKDAEPRLNELGYHVSREGGKGEIFRITRNREGLPHLSVENGFVVAGKPRQNFTEMKQTAESAWRSEQDNLEMLAGRLAPGADQLAGSEAAAARRVLNESGRGLKGHLRHYVGNGIDEATAGLLVNWAPVVDELESSFNVSIAALLEKHINYIPNAKTAITLDELSAFRKSVRTTTVDEIARVPAEHRRAALDKMLKLQPDESSKGKFFEAYSDRAMLDTEVNGVKMFAPVNKTNIEPFRGAGLKNPRTPDGTTRVEVEGLLPPGRVALENKAGENAIKADQAIDYASRSFHPGQKDGGFKLTMQSKNTAYENVAYVCSNFGEARDGYAMLKSIPSVSRILDKEPGGIMVTYLDDLGRVARYP